jgi:hypothetical protein
MFIALEAQHMVQHQRAEQFLQASVLFNCGYVLFRKFFWLNLDILIHTDDISVKDIGGNFEVFALLPKFLKVLR